MLKLSPLLKLLALIGLTTILLLIKNWQLTSLFFAILIMAIFFLKIVHLIRQRIHTLIFISLLIISFQLLFNWQVSLETRLILGLINAEKIMGLSLLVFIYSSTTSFNELIKLFSFLPRNISLAFTVSFSMLTIMLNEMQQISIVQNTRGLNTKSLNPKKSIFPIIIPLLHRSLMRSERIAILLPTRGYSECN